MNTKIRALVTFLKVNLRNLLFQKHRLLIWGVQLVKVEEHFYTQATGKEIKTVWMLLVLQHLKSILEKHKLNL